MKFEEVFYFCHETDRWFGPWFGVWFNNYIKITGLYPYKISWSTKEEYNK